MRAKPKPKIDHLAIRARKALACVEKLTSELAVKSKMTAEQWRVYGQALVTKTEQLEAKPLKKPRRLLGADPVASAFNRWLRDEKLNTGLARHRTVRWCAMWLARHWEDVKHLTATRHHPVAIYRVWHAAQKASERTARHLFGDAVPGDIGWFAMEVQNAAMGLAHAANEIRREHRVTRENISAFHQHVQEAVDVLAKIDAWVAEHEDVLVEDSSSTRNEDLTPNAPT